MCFDIEAVNVIYLVSSRFIHSPQHQAMILPYYLTDLVDLTLNTLVTSVEDDLKKKKKRHLLSNYLLLPLLTCQMWTQGLISSLLFNASSKIMHQCRDHSVHFQLEPFYSFCCLGFKNNCKHEFRFGYYALLQSEYLVFIQSSLSHQ